VPQAFREGERVGPFRLERLLGEGGTATVYLAVREPDGERVALKLAKAEFAESEVLRRRFVHEARAAAAVRHPNLVRIVDAGEEAGRQWLAVELVRGRSLDERLRAEGPLALDDVLRVAHDVAAALDALHAAGLVHRDVKPSNVMLRAGGDAVLADFGLARGPDFTVLTRPGQVVGTLDYLAPELIRGEAATVASDVYALGCTLYACVAGHAPFAGRSFLELGAAHLGEQPPDPGAGRDDWTPALGRALLGALAKDPAARPPRASAFAAVLRATARR
jgi:serine/threonine-protein kinase